MDLFNVYINHILGEKNVMDPNLTEEEKLYVESFKDLEGNLIKHRVYSELVRHVAQLVTDEDRNNMFSILDVLLSHALPMDTNILDTLEPLFITFEPRLSEVLSRSHIFCNCYRYENGPVNTWANRNERILVTEVPVFRYILDTFGKYIEVDSEAYTYKEVYSRRKAPVRVRTQQDFHEMVKQLYSFILHGSIEG